MEKRLELAPRDCDRAICVLISLILLLEEVDLILEEGHDNKNSVSPFSSSGGKIVLTLLTEVVLFYVGLFVVHVRGTGFQEIFLRLLGGGRSSSF